jgi:glycosyltransferase involved in cell wall biosynthesis
MERLRMTFVASTLRMGGAERGTYEVVRRLHLDGADVDAVCLREAGVVGEMLASSGVPVVANLAPSSRDPRAFLRLRAHLMARRPHVVYFLDHTNATFWGTAAASSAGVPVRLLVMHTTGLWGGRSSLPLGVRLALRGMTRVIATANGQAAYLRELGIPMPKLVTIRNGVDIQEQVSPEDRAALRRELGLGDDHVAVGMVAMFRPEKGHEVLLDAVAALRDRHPNLRVFLVGDGPRREELVTAVDRRGLSGVVRFLGLRADAPRLVSAFDVVVLTSHPFVETLPYSLLEAIAQGVPAVATRVGSLTEIVEEGGAGLLVPPGDAEAFGRALHIVLADRRLREEMGRQGRAWVAREFSVERVVRETRELVDELLEAR